MLRHICWRMSNTSLRKCEEMSSPQQKLVFSEFSKCIGSFIFFRLHCIHGRRAHFVSLKEYFNIMGKMLICFLAEMKRATLTCVVYGKCTSFGW